MKVDKRVEKINGLIKEKGSEIYSGNAPDMMPLETEISDFIKILGQLPPQQVRDYANLVNIWAVEVKKMSDKLNQTKTTLRSEIDQAQTQNRAHSAYAKAGKPSGT